MGGEVVTLEASFKPAPFSDHLIHRVVLELEGKVKEDEVNFRPYFKILQSLAKYPKFNQLVKEVTHLWLPGLTKWISPLRHVVASASSAS